VRTNTQSKCCDTPCEIKMNECPLEEPYFDNNEF